MAHLIHAQASRYPGHLLAPQPRRPMPPVRTPSPTSTWSRYPAMGDVPFLVSPAPSVAPSPEPWPPGEPRTSVPMQRVISRPLSPLMDAEPLEPPPSACHRVFVASLRIFFGAAALAVPGGLIWFGLRPRQDT